MLIGIDASRANKPVKTGVEWYAFHLIQELKKITAGGKHQWALYTNEPLTGELAKLPENWYEVRARWAPKYLWTQIRMTWEMWRRAPDIFFEPAHVLPPIRPQWSVVTVHDIGFHRYPQMYKQIQKTYHEHSTRSIVHGRARIITPSEFSARELVEAYGADASRIAPIHLGIDHDRYRLSGDETRIEKTLASFRIPRLYFLYIGRLEMKKNIVGMIKAFDAFKARRGIGDPTVLVLAGPQGYGYEEIQKQIVASPNASQIMQIGYVPEELVPTLIEGARGYLQISWYEGFGIPPLQAMACGCPVIASNNSCMPEVLGEGNAIFVAPDDSNAISSAMDRLIEDPALCDELRRKGIEHAACFTWEKTARETLPVITEWIS